MALLRSAAVLLVVLVCTNAMVNDGQRQKLIRKLPVARADPAALCAQKEVNKNHCNATGPFDSITCSQKNVTAWLEAYNDEAQLQSNKDSAASWAYLTNINNVTEDHANKVGEEVAQWFVEQQTNALRYPPDRYDQRTKEELIRITTTNALCNTTELSRTIELDSKLAGGYSSIHSCFNDTLQKCLTGQAAFADVMAVTTGYDDLRTLWVEYNNGAKGFRQDFIERLNLLNKGAKENGWRDNGYYEWFTDVGDADFLQKMQDLLKEINPLYRELHAYVRHKLAEKYPGKIDEKKAIPIHLTRNMYAQTWANIIGYVKPFPEVADTDITPQLVAQNYTATRIFQVSDDFFASLGFARMTNTFWSKSMLERPSDGRTVDCHGSAWDFMLDDDYRIKQCATPTTSEFITAHHEMGHVAYYMEYRKQRYIHRRGGQSGFHEAVGDTIALSVLTPKHLNEVGLLPDPPTSNEFDINFLMTTALDKLPFFSFALMMDLWRWGTYDGTIRADQYNKQWWKMRLEMGGIAPPAENDRTSEEFFDPGAKYHVSNNVPYIRYFMSHFLQFQFYEAMCNEMGYKGDLHRCDFANSTAAGKKLRDMLAQGRSTNWHDQLEQMTGSREIKASSLLRYFDKLYTWLKNYNSQNKVHVGWEGEAQSNTTTTAAPIPTTSTSIASCVKSQVAYVGLLIGLLRVFRW